MMHFILTILLTLSLTKISCTDCTNKRDPLGYYKLKNNERPHQPITKEEVQVSVSKIGDTMDILTFRRRVFYKFCYEGGSGDPNTGCTKQTKTVQATTSEIKFYYEQGVCPIGYECEPYGECWGSWANQRCGNENLVNQKKGSSSLKWEGDTWTKFAYHTCIQSWECYLHKESVQLFIVDGDKGRKEGFELPTGQFVDINDDFDSIGFTDSNGFKHVPFKNKIIKEQWEETMYCLGSQSAGIICQPKPDSRVPHVSVLFPPKQMSTRVKNYEFFISSNIVNIMEHNIVVFNVKGNVESLYTIKDAYKLGDSPALWDIINIIDSLHYTQLQSIHNIFQLKNDISDLRETIIRLIGYLMQKDPWLLGNIISKDIYTRNIDTKVFASYSCKNGANDVSGNCLGSLIYKEGALVDRSKDDICEHYQESRVKNLTLFDDSEIDAALVHEGEIGVSTKDSSAWSWLIGFKYNQETADNYDNKNSWLSDVYSRLDSLINPFVAFQKYFTLVSSIAVWILILASCIRR